MSAGTVALPNDQIQAAEIEDEPGVANNANTGTITIGTTNTLLMSRSITAPTAGSIVAIATGRVSVSHVTGSDTDIIIGIGDDCDATPTFALAQDLDLGIPAPLPTDTYFKTLPLLLFLRPMQMLQRRIVLWVILVLQDQQI